MKASFPSKNQAATEFQDLQRHTGQIQNGKIE